MEHYANVITDLEESLKQIAKASDCMLTTAKLAIKRCRIALVELKKMMTIHGFPDVQSEIHFFKETKPVVFSYLLYYQKLLELESYRSSQGTQGMKRFLKEKLEEVQGYMEEHIETVKYYHSGFTYLDRLYFVRDTEEIPIELRGEYYLMDQEFNTWQDYNFSVIRANEMLLKYLYHEIFKLESTEGNYNFQQVSQFTWTANKIDLVELIYALYFSKAVNNGNITIKELGNLIGQLFNVEISKDVYRYYIEIQQRKIEQTKFIGHLQSVLQQQIDQNI